MYSKVCSIPSLASLAQLINWRTYLYELVVHLSSWHVAHVYTGKLVFFMCLICVIWTNWRVKAMKCPHKPLVQLLFTIGVIVHITQKITEGNRILNHKAFLVKARELLLVVVFFHEQNKTQFELRPLKQMSPKLFLVLYAIPSLNFHDNSLFVGRKMGQKSLLAMIQSCRIRRMRIRCMFVSTGHV